MKLGREFTLFAVGGLIGLVVDAGTVQAAGQLRPRQSLPRQGHFLFAGGHRYVVVESQPHFRCSTQRTLACYAEWLHWMVLMSGGAAVNYARLLGVFAKVSGAGPVACPGIVRWVRFWPLPSILERSHCFSTLQNTPVTH
jgi:hypothetical protein